MAALITDPDLEASVRSQRAEWGGNRYDEVWEGTYMMIPLPNSEHTNLQARLRWVFQTALGEASPAMVHAGLNVSDRADDWKQNFRCPDVAVVFPDGAARDYGTFHLGGPDFVVEIISPYDRSREKFDFYSNVKVRELLLVDRNPWSLELYRLRGDQLELVGQSTLNQPNVLQSEVLRLSLRLVAGQKRPQIEMRHADGSGHWLA